jgi:hypothetical protein
LYTSLLDILLLKWVVDLPAINISATCLEMSIRPSASMSHGVHIKRGGLVHPQSQVHGELGLLHCTKWKELPHEIPEIGKQ